MITKARHGAFDGRGNRVVRNKAAVIKTFKEFKDRALYAEELIPFEKELAVMVARDVHGIIELFPVAETLHKRNICTEVHAPAPVSRTL